MHNNERFNLAQRRLINHFGIKCRFPNRADPEQEYTLRKRDIKDGRNIRAAGGYLETAEFEAKIIDCDPAPELNERIELQLKGQWKLYFITSIAPDDLSDALVLTLKRRNPNENV